MTTGAASAEPAARWAEMFRDGRAPYFLIIILGVMTHALMSLVMAIIMPTVVAEIGGAAFYSWPTLLYTVGAIVGAAGIGPVWGRLGRRGGSTAGGLLFLAGTIGCGMASDMTTLIIARGLQGLGAGSVTGGGMALVSGFFTPAQRKRVLAAHQGMWMIAQLLGPVVGGAFAQFGWWQGAFWVTAPVIFAFSLLAWLKLPPQMAEDEAAAGNQSFPFARLMILTTGVFAVASAGPITDLNARLGLIVLAAAILWWTFRLDRRAENKLYPSDAFALRSVVGLAFWIMFINGNLQLTATLFLPLLLQVVHGVSPIFVSIITICISLGWTIATFASSSWSGRPERFALLAGPIMMAIGVAGMATSAELPFLGILALSALLYGSGIGIHNVHLVTRTMANARPGEERITSSAIPSIRSLGTAFGAATAGILSSIAGLGDAQDPINVGHAISFVYAVNLIPLSLAVVAMFLLVGMSVRR
jgi:MFS family permease